MRAAAGSGTRLAAGLAGLAATGAAASLRQVLAAGGDGLYAGISRFELLSWLAVYALLFPGLGLLAWALEPLWPHRDRPGGGPPAARRLARQTALVLGLAALFWVAEYRGLRWYLLDDRPATAADGALAFGGRLWAAGELSSPAFEPAFGFTTTGLVRRGDRLFPAVAPGALLVAAAAAASGFGPLLFALLAAGSGAALALACGRHAGWPGVATAALLWTVSPMVLLLGMGGSGELVGRSFLALAWAAWLVLAADPEPPGEGTERRRLALAAGLGIFAALAILSRPVEALCLLLPVFAHLARCARRAELLLAGGLAAAGIAALIGYAQATGVSPWPAGKAAASLGERFAASGSLMLVLVFYFAGPPALALLALAFRRGGELVLAASAALLLLLAKPLWLGKAGAALAPTAEAAAALPLLVLATLGVGELRRRLAAAGLSPRPFAAFGLAAAAASLALASYPLAALGDRAALLRALAAPTAGIEPSIVLVEPAPALWRLRPDLGLKGSWRGELPHPDPFLRGRVIFADAAKADPQLLARAFPRRQLHLLRAVGGAELYRLERLR